MKFSDVIGNSEAINRLRRMVDNDKIPHALLLLGDPAVSKLALAQAFAQYIHCENHINGDSCGKCPSCLQHQNFNHVDTFYSFPILKKGSSTALCADFLKEWKEFLQESTIENYEHWLSKIKNENGQPKIYTEESDEIIKKMSLTAYSSRYKIHIMWLPEKMQPQCANALLKIIEEPYPDSLFILVSNNYQEILPTIFSRTQRVELKKPSNDMVAQYLAGKYGLDMQDALAIAAPTDGNIALAEESIKQESENKDFNGDFQSLMRLSYQIDLKSLKDWSVHIADYKREKICRFLQYASRMVRENYIYNLHTSGLNYQTREEEQFSIRFAPFINELNVEDIINELNYAERDIHGNANAKIVLFDLAIKMTIFIRRKK